MEKYFYNFEERLNQLLERDDTFKEDIERRSLFYIIAGNDDLYRRVDYIYDFKKHSINPGCLEDGTVDFSSGARKLVKLAFNLYNGYPTDVLDTFCILDDDNFNLALGALKLRFQRV